jgi:hypothetical protein
VDNSLRRLVEIDGVIGALVVGKDGLVVTSTLDGEQEELVGAMVAAAYDAAGRYVEQIGAGQIRYALFETPGGTLQIANSGEMLVVVQSTRQASLGRVRLELLQAAQRLTQQRGAY